MSAHSTIGVTVKYRPVSNVLTPPASTDEFTLFSNEITAIPAFDNAPTGIDVTPLSELTTIRRIPGLKDNGEDFALTGNYNDTDIATWETIMNYVNPLEHPDGGIIFEFTVPGITKKYYIAGKPVALGLPSMDVNSAFQGEYHIVPYKDYGWLNLSTSI